MEKRTLEEIKKSLEKEIERHNITRVRKHLISLLKMAPEDNCQIFLNLTNWAIDKCEQNGVSLLEPFDGEDLVYRTDRQLTSSDITKSIKALERNFSNERVDDVYGVCMKTQVDEKLNTRNSSPQDGSKQKTKEKNKFMQIIDGLINKFKMMMVSANRGITSFSDKVSKSTSYLEEKAQNNPNKVLGFIMNIGSLFYKIILLPLRAILKLAKVITGAFQNPNEVNNNDTI